MRSFSLLLATVLTSATLLSACGGSNDQPGCYKPQGVVIESNSYYYGGDEMAIVNKPRTLYPSSPPDNVCGIQFSVTGLPPGMSIDRNTGIITGTPTQVGLFEYTVTAATPYLDRPYVRKSYIKVNPAR